MTSDNTDTGETATSGSSSIETPDGSHTSITTRSDSTGVTDSTGVIWQALGYPQDPWFTGYRRVQKDIGPLTGGDLKGLSRLIRGREARDHSDRLVFPHRYYGQAAVTAHGGYNLLYPWKEDGPLILNLDIGEMVSTERLNEYRQQIIELAPRKRKDAVIPVGQTALNRATNWGGGDPLVRHVYHQGLEGVFTVGHDYYLSGYDTQESPPLYFLCQLPHAVATVDEAREALMPRSVRIAIEGGARVVRQGDLFAIASDMTDGGILNRGGNIFNKLKLYGTAHITDRVAQMPNGQELASGNLMHRPEGREPDHADRPLDAGWWYIIPNTVPKVERPGTPPRSNTVVRVGGYTVTYGGGGGFRPVGWLTPGSEPSIVVGSFTSSEQEMGGEEVENA